jgi:hypothetical protein
MLPRHWLPRHWNRFQHCMESKQLRCLLRKPSNTVQEYTDCTNYSLPRSMYLQYNSYNLTNHYLSKCPLDKTCRSLLTRLQNLKNISHRRTLYTRMQH